MPPSWLVGAGIEVLAQAPPAVEVVVLQLLQLGRVLRHPLRKMGLEHEGHGVGQLRRLELAFAGMFEGELIRSMGQHAIVQRDAARQKPLRLGIIDAVDQAHELRHQIAMVPGWPERILSHLPAFGKDDEIDIGVPGVSDGAVRTVKIDGSGWSNSSAPTGEKRRRSY